MFARKFLAAFDDVGQSIEGYNVVGVLSQFMMFNNTISTSSAAYSVLLERLNSTQSILRLLNTLARVNSEKYQVQRRALSALCVQKIQAKEWRQDLNLSQKVFLLKVLTKLQEA